MDRKIKYKLTAGLVAAIAFDTVLQLTWKTAVLDTPAEPLSSSAAQGVFLNPLMIGVVLIMGLQFFNWLMVLDQADLSYVKPLASLSYASVPMMSFFVLKESVDIVEIMGIAFVIIGVWFISWTNPSTGEASKLP